MVLTLVEGRPPEADDCQSNPHPAKAGRDEGTLLFARPNNVRVSPRQGIIANLSTVAIIIVGGR